jgi:hypothetical protein
VVVLLIKRLCSRKYSNRIEEWLKCLPSKCMALSSNSSTTKKKEEEGKKEDKIQTDHAGTSHIVRW